MGLRGWVAGVDDVHERILRVGDTDSTDVGMICESVFLPTTVGLVQERPFAVQVAIGIVIAASLLVPGAFAYSALIKRVISHVIASAAAHWLGLSLSVAAGVLVGAIVPSSDPMWTLNSGIGTLMSGLLVMVAQEIHAKKQIGRFMPLMSGDYIGLWLALLGFFLASGASALQAVFPATYHLLNVLGAVVSGIGLLVTLGTESWNDGLGAVGFLDEAISAGSFGYAVVQAFGG